MKIKFLATAQSPDCYSFDGETVIAHYNGLSERFDLSQFSSRARLQGCYIPRVVMSLLYVILGVIHQVNCLLLYVKEWDRVIGEKAVGLML